MKAYEVNNNEICIGGISAANLISKFGSPLYVYNESVIKERYRSLYRAIPYEKKRIHYAMKANSNIRILEVLNKEGCFIDAVSKEEIMIALKAGFSSDRILFTGINLSLEDMDFAVKNNVRLNIGSIGNLKTFGEHFPGSSISIRVNPDMGAGHHDHVVTGGIKSKFGIFYGKGYYQDIEKAMAILKQSNIKLSGLHAHIGSGILDEGKFIELMSVILNLAKDFSDIEFIDFGGGLGVPYRPEENDFDFDEFGKNTTVLLDRFFQNYKGRPYIAFEPGRYLTAESGILLVTILDIKSNPKYTFAGVDSGFNHLIRPMAYGSYHPVVNASKFDGKKKDIVVAGYLCESGDVFTRSEKGMEVQPVSDPEAGDILAILNTGAYGFAMSSNYNSRPRPAEVLVFEGNAKLIRRRETLDDLLLTQI